MKKYHKLLLVTAISATLFSCSHQPKALSTSQSVVFESSREATNFPLYVEELKAYARLNGISEQTIKTAFTGIHHVEHVIAADKNQPERKITLNEYLARALAPARLALAKEKYLQYYPELSNAARATGIPQHYLLALWGVESGYGRYQGKEDIISAVATLAFEGRREAFFSKELISALTVLDKGYISKDKFKGSWAGAMGQCQFMPSSLLAYGKDGDGDGIIDIWNNTDDVFASIGNYLATVGWQANARWGNKIALPKNFIATQAGLDAEKAKTIAEWKKLGITITDGKDTDAANQLAWVIIPDDESSQAYLVYNNFKTLMHWNRSYSFAVSVGLLADSVVAIDINSDK